MVKYNGIDLPYTGPGEGRQAFLDKIAASGMRLPWPLMCIDCEEKLEIAMPIEDYTCPSCGEKIVEW